MPFPGWNQKLLNPEMMFSLGFPTCCSSWTLWSNSLSLIGYAFSGSSLGRFGDTKFTTRVNLRSGMWPVHHFPHGLLNCKKPWVVICMICATPLEINMEPQNHQALKRNIWTKPALLGFDVHPGCIWFALDFFHWYPRWWFQTFFIFTPIWGRFPFWLRFLRWVESTNQYQFGRRLCLMSCSQASVHLPSRWICSMVADGEWSIGGCSRSSQNLRRKQATKSTDPMAHRKLTSILFFLGERDTWKRMWFVCH